MWLVVGLGGLFASTDFVAVWRITSLVDTATSTAVIAFAVGLVMGTVQVPLE